MGARTANGAARRPHVRAAETATTAATEPGSGTDGLPLVGPDGVAAAARVGLTPPPCLRRVKRLEAEGVITGYRAVIDPRAAGRAFEVVVAVEIAANDRRTVEEFETSVVAFDEVVAVRRLFGKPDYFVHVAVADAEAFEAFQMSKLIGLPAVARAVSHQTMKRLKG
ncbi:Lrp/AsnC family transcriptional regulator [Geodermatophilus siccatus]|uniref:Lrp/AsnC family transcriptional regulator n=1 Tax=Geodermatophilus siccatus TaxID=1137991 RepID=UPI000B83A0F5